MPQERETDHEQTGDRAAVESDAQCRQERFVAA